MKKKILKMGVICFLFFVFFFFMIQVNLSFRSRTRNVTPSINSGIERLKLKRVFKQNSLVQPESLGRGRPPPPPWSAVPESSQSQATESNCDRTHKSYDICKINGPTSLDPRIATFYSMAPYSVEKIRPYPRKWESFTMKMIREITLISSPQSPSCKIQHNVPALVFSAGGYTGNFFHDFNDGLIPLFITVNSVFPEYQDFILVISKAHNWWLSKYADLLQIISKHPIINLDNDTSIRCFTSATIGLISHGFMTIKPKLLPNSKTFTHFRALLDKAYRTRCDRNHLSMVNSRRKKPRLVLASRSGNIGRVFLNQNEVKNLAEDIGFDVIVFEPKSTTPLWKAYALINSSHAMVGVHGAALTHALFLRPGSVFLQVVPLGNEWVGEYCYGNLGRGMGLEYMEYRIGVEESSLIDKYGKNSSLIKDPIASQGKNWSSGVMNIYLKEQNVRVDLIRFRDYLNRAYKKAKKFMDNEG